MSDLTDLRWSKIVEMDISETTVAKIVAHIEFYLRSKLFSLIRTVGEGQTEKRRPWDSPDPIMTVPVLELVHRITVDYEHLDPKGFKLETNAGNIVYKLFAPGEACAVILRVYTASHHVKLQITHYDQERQKMVDTYLSIN